MPRLRASAIAFVLLLGGAVFFAPARAQGEPKGDEAGLEAVTQAFLTGSALPDPGTGPGRDRILALRQRILAVQGGTDGSDAAKKKLREDIDAVSALVGQSPPKDVIDSYLRRQKGAARESSAPPAPARRPEADAKPAPTAQEEAAARAEAAERGDAALRRALAASGNWNGSENRAPFGVPGLNGTSGLTDLGGLPPRAQLPQSFRPWSAAPPDPYDVSRGAVLSAPSHDTRPIWNPSGNKDVLSALGDYVHDWLGLKNAADREDLAHVDRDSRAACAGGLSAGCVGYKTLSLSGHVVTGVQQQGEDLTSPDVATRQRAVVGMTPLALAQSVPDAAAALRDMHREGYSWPSIGAASLAMTGVAVDASGLGVGKTLEKSLVKTETGFLEHAARERLINAGFGSVSEAERAAEHISSKSFKIERGDISAILERAPCRGATCTEAEWQARERAFYEVTGRSPRDADAQKMLSRFRESMPDAPKRAPAVAETTPERGHTGPIPAPKTEEITGFTGLEPAKPKTAVQGGGAMRKRWKDPQGNIYEWDSQEGMLEKYDSRGKHLGEFNPKSGAQTKPADKTREVEP
jgi:hypothetical protein